jgi:predicted PurR-regulated permease PerM
MILLSRIAVKKLNQNSQHNRTKINLSLHPELNRNSEQNITKFMTSYSKFIAELNQVLNIIQACLIIHQNFHPTKIALYFVIFFFGIILRTAFFRILGGDGGDDIATSSCGVDEAPTSSRGGDEAPTFSVGSEVGASFGNHPFVVFFLGFLFLEKKRMRRLALTLVTDSIRTCLFFEPLRGHLGLSFL